MAMTSESSSAASNGPEGLIRETPPAVLAELDSVAEVGRQHMAALDPELADAVGFRYRYDAERDQWAHPAGAVFVTTRWTVVLSAGRKSSPQSDRALGELGAIEHRQDWTAPIGRIAISGSGDGAVPATAALWERQMLTKARTVFGDSDFCAHVSAAAESAAYHISWTPQMTDEFFNVGMGVKTTINELVHLLLWITGSNLRPEYRPQEQIFVSHRVGSTEKAKRMLGFEAEIPLDAGLRSVVEWRNQARRQILDDCA